MGKMTVYHGGSTAAAHPKIIKGRNTKDFGSGFYCTIIREQAERWAKRYDKPMVSTYTVRMNTGLKILGYRQGIQTINSRYRQGTGYRHRRCPACCLQFLCQ